MSDRTPHATIDAVRTQDVGKCLNCPRVQDGSYELHISDHVLTLCEVCAAALVRKLIGLGIVYPGADDKLAADFDEVCTALEDAEVKAAIYEGRYKQVKERLGSLEVTEVVGLPIEDD